MTVNPIKLLRMYLEKKKTHRRLRLAEIEKQIALGHEEMGRFEELDDPKITKEKDVLFEKLVSLTSERISLERKL